MSMLMLTDISLNSRDVPIITVTASPRHHEVAEFSKEQISAGVVEALARHQGRLHDAKDKTSAHQDVHEFHLCTQTILKSASKQQRKESATVSFLT